MMKTRMRTPWRRVKDCEGSTQNPVDRMRGGVGEWAGVWAWCGECVLAVGDEVRLAHSQEATARAATASHTWSMLLLVDNGRISCQSALRSRRRRRTALRAPRWLSPLDSTPDAPPASGRWRAGSAPIRACTISTDWRRRARACDQGQQLTA